jgi:hypothetical protein
MSNPYVLSLFNEEPNIPAERSYILMAPEGIRIPSKPIVTPVILEDRKEDAAYYTVFPSLESLCFVHVVIAIQSTQNAPSKTDPETKREHEQNWIQTNDNDWDLFIRQTSLKEKCKSLLVQSHTNLLSCKKARKLQTLTVHKLFNHLKNLGISNSIHANNVIETLDIPPNLKQCIYDTKYWYINENKFKKRKANHKIKRCRLLRPHQIPPTALPAERIYSESYSKLPR